jgi:hypothetical protein
LRIEPEASESAGFIVPLIMHMTADEVIDFGAGPAQLAAMRYGSSVPSSGGGKIDRPP